MFPFSTRERNQFVRRTDFITIFHVFDTTRYSQISQLIWLLFKIEPHFSRPLEEFTTFGWENCFLKSIL